MIRYIDGMYIVENVYGEMRKFATKRQAIHYFEGGIRKYVPTKQEIRLKKLKKLNLIANDNI